jgi:hypothetical protein
MKIPQVRARLRELGTEHGIEELRDLAEELRRRSPTRRAAVQSAELTDELAAAVAAYATAYPDHSFASIAGVFKINPGRVSEIISGKRR